MKKEYEELHKKYLSQQKEGTLVSIIDGKLFATNNQKFPIETYVVTLAWAEDMLRAINGFGKFRKFLIRLVLGRYAFRELVGLDESINVYGFDTTTPYDLTEMDYHKDKVKL